MIADLVSLLLSATIESIGDFFGRRRRRRRRRFTDSHVFVDERFSLGTETRTRSRYLAIPVSNSAADYEEYYRLSRSEYSRFTRDLAAAVAFADECRARHRDDRLIVQPGSSRGVPR
jgi:hypothetical protein